MTTYRHHAQFLVSTPDGLEIIGSAYPLATGEWRALSESPAGTVDAGTWPTLEAAHRAAQARRDHPARYARHHYFDPATRKWCRVPAAA